MAMNWIKGLVAPPAFGAPQQPQQPQQGGAPWAADAPPIGGMQPPAPPVPGAMEWSVGTRTQGAAQPVSAGATDARLAQLQHDVESLALFARTLLTMLEEAKVVTREQFEATKQRLDMLDGKLDDR